MFEDKSILLTGGTGSFGHQFVRQVLRDYPGIRRLVVYSRDELKQIRMAQEFPIQTFPQLHFVIGDVRDAERLKSVCKDIDIIVHAAAMKHVPIAEANPSECLKTNVDGARNIIEAASANAVAQVLSLSTDKAASPISVYGASKLAADKLFTSAGNGSGSPTKFSVVRYGNFIGSSGSVMPLFLEQRHSGTLFLAHPAMTRFSISLEASVALALRALSNSMGGELFVPKIPSYRLADLAEAVAPDIQLRQTGLRPGDKMHEAMITSSDAHRTLELDDLYVQLPSIPSKPLEDYQAFHGGRWAPEGFAYESDSNPDRLSVDDLRAEIRRHIDADFEPMVVQK